MKIDHKLLIAYLSKSLRFILISTLLTTLIGFVYVINETPRHEVSIIIAPNMDDDKVGLGANGIVASLVGAGAQKPFIFEFERTIFSLDVAKRLDENENLLFKIFKDFYDEETKSYAQINNLDSRLKKIKFWFYGIDYKSIPNHFMLRDYIKGSVNVSFNDFSGLIDISSLTSNPYETQEMIKILLRETDNSFKEIDKTNTEAKIDYLYKEISRNKEVNQIAAISSILQTELLKKSMMGSSANYKFRTVRGFEMSEYPIYPNFTFILMLFTFFGFFGSLAYKIFRFVLNIPKD